MASFPDHFSRQAAGYAVYRPTYPRTLFVHLASLCPQRCWALDCATGSGQAARGLSEAFTRVIACDASAAQVARTPTETGIHYLVAAAEAAPVTRHSIDLVVVAQALHWFDRPRFFREVQRVLTVNGVFAAWCYGLAKIDPAVDAAVEYLYSEILGNFWPEERRFVESGYAEFSWPFPLLQTPAFHMGADWTRDDLIGYLRTWSAVQRYQARHEADPVALIHDQLVAAWPDRFSRKVAWPLTVKVGMAA